MFTLLHANLLLDGFFMTAGSFLLSQDEVFIDFLFLPYKPTKPN